jgi:hypothetical protein
MGNRIATFSTVPDHPLGTAASKRTTPWAKACSRWDRWTLDPKIGTLSRECGRKRRIARSLPADCVTIRICGIFPSNPSAL